MIAVRDVAMNAEEEKGIAAENTVLLLNRYFYVNIKRKNESFYLFHRQPDETILFLVVTDFLQY